LWNPLRIIHFLLVRQQPYTLKTDFADLPRPDLRDALVNLYGDLFCKMREQAEEFREALNKYEQGIRPRPESVIEHFVSELGGYLYEVDEVWTKHQQLKQSTTRTVFRWCQAQVLDATSAIIRLIRQLSFAAARKITTPVHVVHGAYTYQFQHTAIQLWENSLKRPSCMFLTSEEMWRASQLRMIFFYAQVAPSTDAVYWFTPHVRDDPSWHAWRYFVLGRDLLSEPDLTQDSKEAHALLRRFFEMRPFNRQLLPLYLQILSYDDLDWSQVRPDMAAHCDQSISGLIAQCGNAPDTILYYLQSKLQLGKKANVKPPPPMPPAMFYLDPTVVSPPNAYPRKEVTEDGFAAMMELEWYARHVPTETYAVERRGYTYSHRQLDSPLIRTGDQEWIGLSHKTRACLPLEIHESYHFSGTFEQSRQVLQHLSEHMCEKS